MNINFTIGLNVLELNPWTSGPSKEAKIAIIALSKIKPKENK